MSTAGGEEPVMIVDVPAGDAHAGELLGAVDSVLAAAPRGATVRVLVGEHEPDRAALSELCDADPRLALAAPESAPGPAPIHVVVPPSARPGRRTLRALAELLAEGSAGALEVAVPGRLGRLRRTALAARLPGSVRVRAVRPGAGGSTLRVSARRVALGSSRSAAGEPPPEASLATERAEHLRHRARSATNRARVDRNAQRITRELMRYQHERARAALLDRRLAEVSPRHRLGLIVRRARRLALAPPLRLWALVKRTRSLARRARRFLTDQLRRRRSPGPRPGPGAG